MRLINDLTGEYLEVLTDFGAGLNDLQIQDKNNQLTSVIDGYRSESEIINDHNTSFKGSKLSPFPNRIPDGVYEFEGTKYQLPITEVGANNNLHALLHNQTFQILDQEESATQAVLKLGYEYKGEEKGYPFLYSLRLTYTFGLDGILINTEIENLSDTSIPMGDGWHPYFKFDDLNTVQLQMGSAKRMSSNFGNTLNSHHGFEQSRTINEDTLDDCFQVNGEENFSIQLEDANTGLAVEIWQDSAKNEYNYFQIYTPPSRKTLAIEPVTCMPNAFNTGEGLIILEPKQVVSMSFGIKYKLLNN